VPPLSGFWGKWILFETAVKEERFWIVGALIAGGMLTLFSMVKIWLAAFWGKPGAAVTDGVLITRSELPAKCVPLVLAAVAGGLAAPLLVETAEQAVRMAADHTHYRNVVLEYPGVGVSVR
jgi:multicomponent Na+:H+ antiporter subunit D